MVLNHATEARWAKDKVKHGFKVKNANHYNQREIKHLPTKKEFHFGLINLCVYDIYFGGIQ